MAIKNVTILGTGVLGTQIAYQCAYHGFKTTAYDIADESIAKGKKIVEWMHARYPGDLTDATPEKIAEADANLSFTTDLAAAVADADLVIEAVPEVPAIKTETYEKLAKLAPEKTIFCSNSSTLLPSSFAGATGRPEKFLALHFANEIWNHNIAEVMAHPGTDPAIYDIVVQFARDIGMEPVIVKKEQPGYVLNSLLVPLLKAASGLLMSGVSDPESIDKAWTIGTGAPKGPFQIYDIVGLTTAYNVNMMGDDNSKAFAAYLKENYIDKGKLGLASGEGFYKYS